MSYVEPVIINKLLFMCFGYGKKKKLEDARKVLNYLYEKKAYSLERAATYDHISVFLGLDKNSSQDRVTFSRLMLPLLGKNALQLHVLGMERVGHIRHFYLSYESFGAIWKNINQQAQAFLSRK